MTNDMNGPAALVVGFRRHQLTGGGKGTMILGTVGCPQETVPPIPPLASLLELLPGAENTDLRHHR
jgi:hypothetical protein